MLAVLPPPRLLTRILLIAVAILLVFAPLASADASTHPPVALPTVAIWAFAVSWFVPLVTYLVNRLVPSEPVSGIVLAIAAAASGALTQAIDTGGVGFNQTTFQLIVIAVVGALSAHHGFWKPTTISARFRGKQALLQSAARTGAR